MNAITLYHFTSAKRVMPIQAQGLTLGHVPVLLKDGKFGLNPGFQWLTTNPEWVQPWATRMLIKEDRAEVRMEITIPASEIQSLARWTDVQGRFGWRGNAAEGFNLAGEGENWILFQGNLPAAFINNTVERPKDHGKQAAEGS
jgi:hypothetical protein